MKILGTGLTGLVGSRIVELLTPNFSFENISRSTGVDITKKDAVFTAVSSTDAPFLLHLAAKTNVDACEEDKSLGEKGEAWQMNVLATQHIVDACEKNNKKLIYVSTDFVFDGKKEFYIEEDVPNPINWYAKTKYEGEKIVRNSRIPWVIVRISYPYRAAFTKNDFFRALLQRLQQKKEVFAITDHIFKPTYIDDIASALEVLINKNVTGTYHVTGSEFLRPYDAALTIADMFGCDRMLIHKVIREEYFKGKAPRPFRLVLKNDKIENLGISMISFSEGLRKIKEQL